MTLLKSSESTPQFDIPVVDFYDDAASWPTSELIHSEPLAERSKLHGWRIHPHRHSHLTQMFFLAEGFGSARLDSVNHDVKAPSILIVPERCVHDFVWDKGCRGFVLSITSVLTNDLGTRIGAYDALFREPSIVRLGSDCNYLETLFEGIHDEFVDNRRLKEMSLECRIGELTVWLARAVAGRVPVVAISSRAKKHYMRFTQLVELNHKAQWSTAEYANEIGITPSHLNAICRQLSGKSALESIHDRLVLAARRDLIYTEKTIAGVAHYLGFADPSYFTRFFKRETGIVPSEFRRRSGTLRVDHGV